MWRITGFLFFNDKDYFVDKTKKAFCKERLISFLQEGYCLVRHSLCHTAPAGQCLGQVSGSSAAYGHSCPTAPDTAMQGYRHHRREGNGHAVHAVFHRQAQSRRLHGVSFRKPSDAPLPDAFFLKSLPAGTGKKSSSVSHYVSGLTDVVSNFLYKISTSVTCIFESLHYLCSRKHGSSSVGRAPVSKTGCREFEPLLPCMNE